MLPERLFHEPIDSNGPSKGKSIDRKAFLECREHYYRLNGWDPETGNPTPTKLHELGLGWVVDVLRETDG
jgi:aldehyde:ferredoxin oxidoreductase